MFSQCFAKYYSRTYTTLHHTTLHSDNSEHQTLFLPESFVLCDRAEIEHWGSIHFLLLIKSGSNPRTSRPSRWEEREEERSDLNKYNSAQIRDYCNPTPHHTSQSSRRVNFNLSDYNKNTDSKRKTLISSPAATQCTGMTSTIVADKLSKLMAGLKFQQIRLFVYCLFLLELCRSPARRMKEIWHQ